MKLRNILLLVLALCMVFALCACGGNNETPKNTEGAPGTTEGTTTADGTEDTTAAPDDTADDTTAPSKNESDNTETDNGQVAYTVTVVDEGGNPVAGALVQLCLESCFPGVTNADGKVTYRMEKADYKVSFVSMPTGYTSDVNEFHFEEGKFELTITLKAVS